MPWTFRIKKKRKMMLIYVSICMNVKRELRNCIKALSKAHSRWQPCYAKHSCISIFSLLFKLSNRAIAPFSHLLLVQLSESNPVIIIDKQNEEEEQVDSTTEITLNIWNTIIDWTMDVLTNFKNYWVVYNNKIQICWICVTPGESAWI